MKIRGFRVEPGEVEACLNAVTGVVASAVVSHSDDSGHVMLVAYWMAATSGGDVTMGDLRAALARSLPDYMYPARVERVQTLPLTLNGKIDRKRLQVMSIADALQNFGAEEMPAAPVVDLEELETALLDVAGSVVQAKLKKEDAARSIGEIGLDSIRLAALSVRIARVFGVSMEEAKFFELKSLRGVARFLATMGIKTAARPTNGGAPQPVRRAPRPSAGSVAIVGIEARLPGADDLRTFWHNLVEGIDGVGTMPAERMVLSTSENPTGDGGFIGDVDKFDAPFFGLSRREATVMDPRQRLFLEAVWRAVENAGVNPAKLAGTRTGVFVGVVGGSEYARGESSPVVDAGAQRLLGAATSLIAGRVSYFFDLRGPCSTIDTACSGSLVALHRAVTSLRSGECDQAIVGGVNLVLDPITTREAAKTGMISPTGRCRAFDAAADGYVRGEGVIAMMLKPLQAAEAAGDPIYALVLGTAENHGGRAAGLTAPNPEAQRDVITAALRSADVAPDTVTYVEAHGTGTQLGDPIEVNGLCAAWIKSGASERARCALGAVKSQLGHLEAAAGLAGVVKTVLALRAGVLPGNLHLQRTNPRINLEDTPFHLVDRKSDWPRINLADGHEQPRRGGVSSFGFSGINAHAVLEEYVAVNGEAIAEAMGRRWPISLSARTPVALVRTAELLAAAIDDNHRLADVALTLAEGRDQMTETVTFFVQSMAELRSGLALIAAGERPATMEEGDSVPPVPAGGRRIHLPGYGFERRSYWAKSLEVRPPTKLKGLAVPARWEVTKTDPILAQHVVGGRAILPAVAYLDFVWRAVTTEMGDFSAGEFQDVTWLRPFLGGELRVVLNADSGGFHFVVESGDLVRPTKHVAGKLFARQGEDRWEREDLSGLTENWGTRDVYEFFAKQGVDYGSHFRTVDRLSWGDGKSVAELVANDDIHLRGDLRWHGGLLDGMLQTAALVRIKSGATAGLPFAVERVRFLAPLTNRMLVRVQCGTDDTWDIVATDPAGKVLVTWHGYAVRPPTKSLLPSSALGSVVARVAEIDPVTLGLEHARVEEECAALAELEDIGRLVLLGQLQARGVWSKPGSSVTRAELHDRLKAWPKFHRLADSLVRYLSEGGLVEEVGGRVRATSRLSDAEVIATLADRPAAQARFVKRRPNFEASGRFVWTCAAAIPDVIAGATRATDLMFPQGSVEFISKIYEGNLIMDFYNRVAAETIRQLVEDLAAERGGTEPIRMLEVGAGSGATSQWIAQALMDLGLKVEYVFTDISIAFRRHGERRFAGRFPFMRFAVLNIEKDPVAQGFALGGYDVVIGANVYHTVHSLHRSMQMTKRLLRPGGALVLVEGTAARVLNGLTYGLLDGWWNTEDPERRLPDAPLCDEAMWTRIL
ncbi:MAG: polyketide synthase dehydratase domain-containing protein, partial [Candidatus Synoicihabitans palmerolidicus]|nr:polyketide synthase dehydratase domain-containing protein [Candidatus Synoicihabitans palmerolidicus]